MSFEKLTANPIFVFKLTHTSSKSNARVGKVFTDRGKIDTPIFMPVGTLGSVKGVFQHDLDKKNM